MEKNSVMVYHSFIEGNLKMTDQELYVYGQLYTKKTYEDVVETSLDILAETITLLSIKKKNKVRLAEVINELAKYDIIKVQEQGKVLTITFPKQEGGFVAVPYSKVRELSPTDFLIYCAVAKWENNPETGKARYSYERWATILNCGVRTAIRAIDGAVEKGIIFKQVGKYVQTTKAQAMQDLNTYSIAPFPDNGQADQPEPIQESVEEVKPEPKQYTSKDEINSDVQAVYGNINGYGTFKPQHETPANDFDWISDELSKELNN